MGVVNVQYWLPHLRTLHPLNPSHQRSSTGASEDDGTMTISGRNVVGIHATTTPQSFAARDFQCDYHFFFIPPRPPLVNAVSCYYYSDSVVANKNCFNFTIISFGMHIFLGSHPISAITNECPISPSHEVLCETRP